MTESSLSGAELDGTNQLLTTLAVVTCAACAAGGPRSILPALQPGQKLLHVVEGWLRQEREGRSQRQQQEAAAAGSVAGQSQTPVVPSRTPLMPNKHLAFFR